MGGAIGVCIDGRGTGSHGILTSAGASREQLAVQQGWQLRRMAFAQAANDAVAVDDDSRWERVNLELFVKPAVRLEREHGGK